MEAEIIVVGGGTSGAVVAGRLAAESGKTVLVLEAGPDYGALDSGRWPSELVDARALANTHDWGYSSRSADGTTEIVCERARVISGCSAHNGCIAAVGHPSDYDAWGMPGWSGNEVRELYARVLTRMRVRAYRDDEAGPFHRACLDAALAMGLPRADDLTDIDAGVGFGLEPVNMQDGVRFNSAFAYLDSARDRPNVTILGDVLVDRLELLESGEVMVHGSRNGDPLLARGGRVVLAAGAYGTPAVLLRSGIGEAAHLQSLGIPVTRELPGVGFNLHDHPMIEVEFTGSEELDRLLAATGGFVPEEQTLGKVCSSLATDGLYDLHLVPLCSTTGGGVMAGRRFIAAAAVYPYSRGRLTLPDRNPESKPILDHGYLSDPEGRDLAVLSDGVRLAHELASQEPLRSLLGPCTKPYESDEAIRRGHGHYYHPVGTCPMGSAHDEMAVCDESGRVHGAPQITIADCSIIPQVPRANTNMPAVMIGEKIADLLVA